MKRVGHSLSGACLLARGHVGHAVGDVGVVAEVVARADAVIAVSDGEGPRTESSPRTRRTGDIFSPSRALVRSLRTSASPAGNRGSWLARNKSFAFAVCGGASWSALATAFAILGSVRRPR